MSELTTRLGELPPGAVYVVAALLVFAETGLVLGLVLPGEVTLLFVGFLAFAGALHPVPAVVVMMLAALAGDTVAYVEGYRFGPRLRRGRLGRWVGEERWDSAAKLLVRHGGRAVFLARFVAFARTLTPRLASACGVSFRRFLLWDSLGVTVQVGGSVVLGYVAGSSYAHAAALFGRATGALLLLGLMIVALVVFGRYLGHHPDPVADFGQRLARWGPLGLFNRGYEAAFAWLTTRAGMGGAVGGSVLVGVGLLLGIGVSLTWAVRSLVSSSGLPLVDPLVTSWVAAQRTPEAVAAATATLSVLRGSYLVVAAGVVGLVLNLRPARWRSDLLGVLGTVGGFLPLAILGLASEWAGPGTGGEAGSSALFHSQVTLVTASLGMLAWLVGRRVRWGAAVAVWVVAAGLVALVGAARVYVGWSWPSGVVASILLGSLWVVVFAAAWRTRDRLRAVEEQECGGTGEKDPGVTTAPADGEAAAVDAAAEVAQVDFRLGSGNADLAGPRNAPMAAARTLPTT